MKDKTIGLLNKVSHKFNTNILIGLTNQKLILPAYHSISDHKLPHLQHLYSIRNTDLFLNDIDFLLSYYKPIDLDAVSEMTNFNNSSIEKCFHLTFDDGLKEVYEVVYPLLKSRGIPATFFLNTDFIDNKDLFYRMKASLIVSQIESSNKEFFEIDGEKHHIQQLIQSVLKLGYKDVDEFEKFANYFEIDFSEFLKNQQPYLSSSQINEMIADGFTFGAHSLNHPDYRQLPINAQLKQTINSVNEVRENYHQKLKCFAFTFTDDEISHQFFTEVKDKLDLSFGGAGLKKDTFKFHFQRIPMDRNQLPAKTIVNTEYLYYLLKAPFLKNKIKRV